MAEVRARPNESIDQLLKRFKKEVENSGILKELRKREYYEKPSVKRKREAAAARKRHLKNRGKIRPKLNMGNWKWNKDRTKKIELKSYSNTNNKPRFSKPRVSNSGNSNSEYRSRNPNYKGKQR